MSPEIRARYFNEAEVAEILKIKVTALKSRRSRGTNHPPYIQAGKEVFYPKDMFLEWMSRQPVIWEVKGAS